MVIGVGTDILKIERIRNGMGGDSDAFLKKSFTSRERAQASERPDPALYYATRFAGKEAIFKCFGVGGDDVRLDDIEILGAGSGAPEVALFGRARDIARQKGISGLRVSLSYDGEYAVAFALAEG
jgi:phosphopantetheine--protein transferase-like protein